MANPLVSLISGLCVCIRGSLRIILFVLCLIFLLIQAGMFLSVINTDSDGMIFQKNIFNFERYNVMSLVLASVLLVGAAAGTHGAFFYNRRSLKIFTIIVTLSAGLFVLLFFTCCSAGGFTRYYKVEERMANYSKTYDWTDKNVADTDKATLAWDLLQKSTCCGLESYKDWDKLRPDDVPGDMYPSSCCKLPRGQLCKEKMVEDSRGCNSFFSFLDGWLLIFLAVYSGLQVLLAIIGYILIMASPDSGSTTISDGGSGQRVPTPQEYQRFEGSVYVRQPAYVPQYQQQYQTTKNSSERLYPNARDVEKRSPPPSYC